MKKIKRYGWTPDLPDLRDHAHRPEPMATPLPPFVSLLARCPPVYDQGELGSCTANAIAGAFEFDLLRQKIAHFVPSRLFIYYNERVIEGTVGQDSGASLRDGIKTVVKQGVCAETLWPYNASKFARKPPKLAYSSASRNKALQYNRLDNSNIGALQTCLASGLPFVFGFSVYESFESETVAKTGIVPLPKIGEALLGGHAVMAIGYDQGRQAFMARNSWGNGWGLGGCFWIPFAYLTNLNLADDFWVIFSVA